MGFHVRMAKTGIMSSRHEVMSQQWRKKHEPSEKETREIPRSVCLEKFSIYFLPHNRNSDFILEIKCRYARINQIKTPNAAVSTFFCYIVESLVPSSVLA